LKVSALRILSFVLIVLLLTLTKPVALAAKIAIGKTLIAAIVPPPNLHKAFDLLIDLLYLILFVIGFLIIKMIISLIITIQIAMIVIIMPKTIFRTTSTSSFFI
jgi:hypothetical protein